MPGLSDQGGSSQTNPRQTNRRIIALKRSKDIANTISISVRVTITSKLDRTIYCRSKPVEHHSLLKRPTYFLKPDERAATVLATRIE